MKKEALIAILIGVGLGLIITYGFYRFRVSLSQPPTKTVAELLEQTPEDEDDQSQSIIALHSPEDGIVQSETSVLIAGTTLEDVFVVIFINDEETVTTSDESGNFSLNTKLQAGANIISVYVVDSSGETYSEERLVVVTDIFDEANETGENEENQPNDPQTVQARSQALAQSQTQIASENDGELELLLRGAADELREAGEKAIKELDPEMRARLEGLRKQYLEGSIDQDDDSQVRGQQIVAQRRGVIGEIQRVTGEALTISGRAGTTIFPIGPEVELIQDDQPIEVGEVEIGNWALVLGIKPETGNDLVPRYVLIFSESPKPKPRVVLLGGITEVDANKLVIQSRFDESEHTFDLKTTTLFEDQAEEVISRADLEVHLNVLVIGYEVRDENDEVTSIVATRVRSLAPLDPR